MVKPISAVSGPKFTVLRKRGGHIDVNKFFPIVGALVAKI